MIELLRIVRGHYAVDYPATHSSAQSGPVLAEKRRGSESCLCGGGGECLVDVGEDVVDVLDADGEAYEFGGDASGGLLFGGELGMGGSGRMNGEAAGVADVGQVGEQLKLVDKLLTGLGATFDAEDDHGAAFAAEVLLVEGVHWIGLEAGEADPLNGVVRLKVCGDGVGVLAVALHAEGQGLDALEELPGIIGCDAGAEVAEGAGAHAQDVSEGREGLGEIMAPAEAVVAFVGFVVEGEVAVFPVEGAGVDDDAADAVAVTAEPLGQRVNNDGGTVPDGVGQVRRGESAVDDEWDAVVGGDGGDGFEIGDVESGVADGLAEECLGFGGNGGGEVLRIVGVDEFNVDAELGKDVVELGVGAAVEVVGRDDFVSGLSEVDDGVKDGAGARGDAEAGSPTIKGGDALLEHVGGGVHQAGVDVAEFAESEEVGGVLGIIKDEGAGLVEGNGACVGGGFRLVAGMEALGFEFHNKKRIGVFV